MINEQKLREMIRALLQSELEEMTTTGNVAGYSTPYAFPGDKKTNRDRIEAVAKSIGYSLTKRGKEQIKPGDNLSENYYAYRNDTTQLPHQKIGEAIAEVNRQLQIVEKIIRMNGRLKKEYRITNEQLWKRTTHRMAKLEGKLMELAGKLREMRG